MKSIYSSKYSKMLTLICFFFIMTSCLVSGKLLPKVFYTPFLQTLHLLIFLFTFWTTIFFSNRSLRWNPGTLYATIAGCGSIITAIWSLSISCLLLSYVVMNFPLAWLIFKYNRRNSNLILISVSTIMAFPWGYFTSYYSVLILSTPRGIISIFLTSGSGRMRNVNVW